MTSPFREKGASARRAAVLLALPLALTTYPAMAGLVTYNFTGQVLANEFSSALPVGTQVWESFVVDADTADSNSNANIGTYPGAIQSWTITIGSYTATGSGGDVAVCNWGGTDICVPPSFPPNYPPKSDGVRFTGTNVTSGFAIDGYVFCAAGGTCLTANVYDPDPAMVLDTDSIPLSLDSSQFTSISNNGRINLLLPCEATPCLSRIVAFSLSAVPEPATIALVGAALLGVAATRRRKATIPT